MKNNSAYVVNQSPLWSETQNDVAATESVILTVASFSAKWNNSLCMGKKVLLIEGFVR